MDNNGFTRRDFIKSLLFGLLVTALPPALSSKAVAGAPGRPEKLTETGPTVLRVRSGVIKENFSKERYLDSIDRGRLDEMLASGLKSFTGKSDVRAAWEGLLVGYSKGHRVAIKPNFNFINHGQEHTITAPELVGSVVGSLIKDLGVSPGEIYVYDLCKLIPDDMRSRIGHPVNYVERIDTDTFSGRLRLRAEYGLSTPDRNARINMSPDIIDASGRPVECYAPKVLTTVEHLINMPLLTNHTFIASSGALKNHYGTVRFGDLKQYPVALHGEMIARAVADLNRSHHIAGISRVVIADAIFGVHDRGEGTGKEAWKVFDGFPESIFISKDPVAVDSVMASFVIKERSLRRLHIMPHDYLKEAAAAGVGVFELAGSPKDLKRIDYRELAV